jgi:small subunit ribosomal protein S16
MTLKIRLRRGGRKNCPHYSIVVANSSTQRDGKYCAKVGTYNPMLPLQNEQSLTIEAEKIQYWFSVGAQPTKIVIKLLSRKLISLPEKIQKKWSIRTSNWKKAEKKKDNKD